MAQATLTLTGIVELKCKPEWDDCQKKQMCTKVAALNKAAPLQKRSLSAAVKRTKKSWQAKYAREWNNPISPVWPSFSRPKGGVSEFAHPCAETNGKPLQADHMVDSQWGGHAKGPFQWLDASVNTSIGSQMDKTEITTATGFKADCCP
jgi:hypothetical protein